MHDAVIQANFGGGGGITIKKRDFRLHALGSQSCSSLCRRDAYIHTHIHTYIRTTENGCGCGCGGTTLDYYFFAHEYDAAFEEATLLYLQEGSTHTDGRMYGGGGICISSTYVHTVRYRAETDCPTTDPNRGLIGM